ncbi:spermidine synthase [Pseudomonas sp. GCM10022188]|uniref:spermidine synthase n=1 Tax=Pseudomonas TaxID=286 RepID=UPI001E282C97|nr:spermidine synthase [Pseudomonas oryzagri]MCC6074018.1 spermidine synthase [Pseudomonas oryzagri]
MGNYQQLAEVHDDYGVIRVVQSGDYRFLEFGDEVEQSCSYVPDPAWLEYDYTRAMLLGALLPERAERLLFLGLGGGNLTMACLRHLPVAAVDAVELRPAVPRLAREFMGLGEDPRLSIRIGDARALLSDCAPADVIFLDLYTDAGPASAHIAWGFLEACRARLRPGGWLVINQWTASDGKPLGAALLRGVFRHCYWECPVPEGNVILYVPADPEQTLDPARLGARAGELAGRVGYGFDAYLQVLRPAS